MRQYYTSDSGVAAMEWLREHMQTIADQAGRNDTVCELYPHTWAQSSVICHVQGTTQRRPAGRGGRGVPRGAATLFPSRGA